MSAMSAYVVVLALLGATPKRLEDARSITLSKESFYTKRGSGCYYYVETEHVQAL